MSDASSASVDLSSYIDDTDNQQISLLGNILTLSNGTGADTSVDLSSFNNSGADDQALSLSGNTLTLEDGGTVDLSSYLDNTDNQQITDFSISGNIVTLTLEDGGTETIDLSALDNSGTDDQALSLSCLLYTSDAADD